MMPTMPKTVDPKDTVNKLGENTWTYIIMQSESNDTQGESNDDTDLRKPIPQKPSRTSL